MGDEEYTKEELEILGESKEEGQDTQATSKDTGETQEKAETEESTESKDKETEDKAQAEDKDKENMVPQWRVDELTREKHEAKEKLDLLRRDPKAYYEKYPDEKPEKEETETEGTFADVAHMRVQGGTYDGKTLSEVHAVDPFAAMAIYNDYRDTQREAKLTAKETQARLKRESEEEINTFTGTIAKEMFGKEKDKLDSKESKQMEQFIDSILDWMEKTGRASNMADAHFLMHRDDILKAAQVNSTKALIDSLTSGTISTVITQKGKGVDSGYEKFMAYTVDQFAAHVDNLNEAEFKKFIKEAPQKLKDKFPQAAWD
jgi:hypothetical protein